MEQRAVLRPTLHCVLDLWFEKEFRPLCQGEACLTRVADDFGASFQDKRDAAAFHRKLSIRVERFNLALAAKKTRLLLCGHVARGRKAEYAEKPETFDFLGFKHVCGIDRSGKSL